MVTIGYHNKLLILTVQMYDEIWVDMITNKPMGLRVEVMKVLSNETLGIKR